MPETTQYVSKRITGNGSNRYGDPMVNYKDPGLVDDKGFRNIGIPGLNVFAGLIEEAHTAELKWPSVYPVYNRLWRSDPEVSIVRTIFNAFVSSVDFLPQLPDKPTDDDKKFQDFILSDMENMDGGFEEFKNQMVSTVPFFGWGWWEIVPSLRKRNWRSPGGDDWESWEDDGLIGIRRLAYRRPSSFYRWHFNRQRRVTGMWQRDNFGEEYYLPLSKSVHIVTGDTSSPEGLTPLEALWRLERYKYGLELIQGIGFEHAAGYLSVSSEMDFSPEDIERIKSSARAIMSAQEGNYATWPNGIKGEIESSPFVAAEQLGLSIKYYGVLKLQLYNLQWIAISASTGVGAYSSMKDHSLMSVMTFNSMMENFANQINRSYVAWLVKMNQDRFPNLSMKPKLVPTKARKELDLEELGIFMEKFSKLFPVSEDDITTIRRQSGVLGETLPSEINTVTTKEEDYRNQYLEIMRANSEAAQERAAGSSEDSEDKPKGRRRGGVQTADNPDEAIKDAERTKLDQAVQKEKSMAFSFGRIGELFSQFRVWLRSNDPEALEMLDAVNVSDNEDL